MLRPNLARFDKATRIATSLVRDLDRAIAVREMFERSALKRGVASKFNNTYQAWGYNVIESALLTDLIVTLMRIHDTDERSASMPNLIKLLADPSVIAAMKENARRWVLERDVHHLTPIDDEILRIVGDMRQRRAADEAAAIERIARRALRRAAKFETDAMRASLQKYRNKHIAHNAMVESTFGVKYGYPGKLLDRTALIGYELVLAVTGTHIDFRETRAAWRKKGDDFWKHAVLPFKVRKTSKRPRRP